MENQALSKLGAGAVALMVAGVPMLWMAWRMLQGRATLGDMALFYGAFSKGQELVRTLLGGLGKIYINTLFLGNLFKFLELKPEIIDPAVPVPAPGMLREGIEFKGVTFAYPGSDRPALNNFDLYVPAGKITAIVGANGAGKTTLLKLLCRFYDPDKGSIEMDGIDLRRLRVKDLWHELTVLFQQPLNYHATVRESIAMSDLHSSPDAAEIEAAARNAGAHEFIVRLPEGYDTLLGKALADGAELSGGEWQRIAMARAYLRRSPVMLLDEPTSFLDSWSEVDWFSRFRDLARNRTAVIITHRFTIARRADIIHVMDDGNIIESGSHDQLLAHNGAYAASWNAQIQDKISENQLESALVS
jgi:ATP-binding cassette subfamily B protein